MRVAELVEPRCLRLIEQPIPEPGPGEVLARVMAVGVCGSDLHAFRHGAVGDTPRLFPMVLGHEPTGLIAKLGPGVSGWAPGDRVALEPAIYCYHCEYCLSGRHNVCANLRFLSMPGEPGFFRDYVTLPAANLLPLPAGMHLPYATLFEPLAVVLHSMKFIAPGLGERLAVFGAGPIGLLTLVLLKLAGVGRVWVIEPVAHRRELALRLGADAALDPAQEDPVRRILADTGGRGVDAAVDCAAEGPSMNQALAVTRPAGRVVITGIPVPVQVALDFHVMRRKELVVYNVRRSNRESELALELLQAHPDRFGPILTHRMPLEEIERGFALLDRYADGVGKLVILTE